MARDCQGEFVGGKASAIRDDRCKTAPCRTHKSAHFAVLYDVDAQCAGGTRVAPHHRIMTCGASACLYEPALHRKAGVARHVEQRNSMFQVLNTEHLRRYAVEIHRADPTRGALQV